MQTAKCPHCGKDIEVVTAKDLEDDFSISANALQHAREREKFPEPWLKYPNRALWIKSDIDEYASSRTRERVAQRLEELDRLLGGMPEDERKAVLAALSK